MADITASMVKELREATNVGMMECKKALQEADGDKDKAIQLLRERGMAIASKKASRAANQGLVAARVFDGGTRGVMIEVNCETDFVARNATFQAFVESLLPRAAERKDNELAEAVKDELTAKVAEIGENLVVGPSVNYCVQGPGRVVSYIHLGGKVGVLLELGCEKEASAAENLFLETAKDLTLHIAACAPRFLNREQVPAGEIEAERAIYAKQVENKPANIIDKIVDGKMDKFFSQMCLIEQPFVKDGDRTVRQLLDAAGKELGDALTIRRYARFQIGA
jgi:elongation factor Ts